MKKMAEVSLLVCLIISPSMAGAVEVIFQDKSGITLSRNDLKSANGTVKWQITTNQKIPAEENNYHKQGRAYGRQDKTELAVKYFKKAIELAPKWPYPYYDLPPF